MALSAFCYQPGVRSFSEVAGSASPYPPGGFRPRVSNHIACLGVSRASHHHHHHHRVTASLERFHEAENLSPASWPSVSRGHNTRPPRLLRNALPSIGVEGEAEEGTPWEGAILFRRSAAQSRFDYATTLERLGLSRFSSDKTMASAADMGLENPADDADGTPVQITVDVTKEGRDYRIDGVIRTSLAMVCNRCLAPVAEQIYSSFSILLTEAPVKEPTQPNLGVVLGDDVNIWKAEAADNAQAELDIDLDDKLHFPRDQKELDLSKYLRDTIHLEIPAKSLCDAGCLGLCFGCSVNLNTTACRCGKRKKQRDAVDVQEILGLNRKDVWGPLEQLKKQLEEQQQDKS